MTKTETFNDRLRKVMALRGKTVSDVAKAIGGSEDLVFSWVKEGSTRFPIIKTRHALAHFLAVDYVWLNYGGEGGPDELGADPSAGATVIKLRDDLRRFIATACGCTVDEVEVGISIKRPLMGST